LLPLSVSTTLFKKAIAGVLAIRKQSIEAREMTVLAQEEEQIEAGGQALLTATGIQRIFGKGNTAVTALSDIELDVPAGSMVALKGRSGSGKTTLLNILSALDEPTEGQVFFRGKEITGLSGKARNALRRKEIGLVFQSFGLIPLMSAYENVEFGLRIAGTPAKGSREAAERALERVGMRERMKHRPMELSGGEQQRAAIARAIAHEPALLIADEPTAELDSRMGLQVMRVFRDLVRHSGMTVLLTTHDPGIMELVDYVIALEDGKIVSKTTNRF
jgi:putative ABC transport system ATP-binding protein